MWIKSGRFVENRVKNTYFSTGDVDKVFHIDSHSSPSYPHFTHTFFLISGKWKMPLCYSFRHCTIRTMIQPEIPPQACQKCGVVHENSTKIICDACFPLLTKYEIQKFDRIWQEKIIELFGNECVDCGHSAETKSGELCGDHLNQKNADPLARYDLANGVCRCSTCHTKRHSGSIKRVPAKEKMPKQTAEKQKKHTKSTCKTPRCMMFPASGGYCVLCLKKKGKL